jgi:hypothetical protein
MTFGIVGAFGSDEHRSFGHRKQRVCRLDVLGHGGLIKARGHLLHRIEFAPDSPDQEISAGAQTDGRISVNQQRRAKVVDRGDEVAFAGKLFAIAQKPPFGARTIEDKIDELTRDVSFVLFEFLDVRSQAK